MKVDETHPPGRLGDLAVIQEGGTECAWGGENMTDSTYDTGVTLAILPDGAASFEALAKNPETYWATKNTIGQASGFNCNDTGDTTGDWCSGDAVISGYRVSFTVNDISGAKGVGATAAVMADVASAIEAAGPARSNWTPPAPFITGAKWCTDADSAARVSSAMGTTMTLSNPNPEYTAFDTTGVAEARAAVIQCGWKGSGGQSVDIATLPAGSWALPLVAAQPPLWTLLGRPVLLTVSGSDGAVFACGDGCQAMVAVDGSLLQIYESGNDDVSPTFPGTVQRFVDSAKAG